MFDWALAQCAVAKIEVAHGLPYNGKCVQPYCRYVTCNRRDASAHNNFLVCTGPVRPH